MKSIISFIGRAGSGKGYQCSLLQKDNYVKLSFADALRDIAYTSLAINDRTAEHYDNLKLKNCIEVIDSWGTSESDKLTNNPSTGHYLNFREFLQLLGTEGIRKYDNNFWTMCLIKTIQDYNLDKVCIDDMRFANEFRLIKEFAEKNNYEFKCYFCDYHSFRYQNDDNHESAKLSNNLVKLNYKDLQLLTLDDIEKAESMEK